MTNTNQSLSTTISPLVSIKLHDINGKQVPAVTSLQVAEAGRNTNMLWRPFVTSWNPIVSASPIFGWLITWMQKVKNAPCTS